MDGGDGEAVGGEIEGGGCRAHRLSRFRFGRMNQPRQRGLWTKILMEPQQGCNTMTLDQMNGLAHTCIREPGSVAPRRKVAAYHSQRPTLHEIPALPNHHLKPPTPASAPVSPPTKSSRPFATFVCGMGLLQASSGTVISIMAKKRPASPKGYAGRSRRSQY